MEDAGDGDGEGGGEITTLSNSDLQESEEKVIGKEEDDIRAMETVMEEEKQKLEEEKQKLEKQNQRLWQMLNDMKMKLSGKEKEKWNWERILNKKRMRDKKAMWKAFEIEIEIEKVKEKPEKEKREKEKKEIREKKKEIWEKMKKKWEKWEWDKEKWEKDKEMWEKDKEIWEKDKEKWEKDKKIWENEEWEKIREFSKEKWEKDKEKWEKDKEIWENEEWEKIREFSKEKWEKDKEEWENKEIRGTKMGTKTKEKEPEPLPGWEMGMEKCLCLLGCGPEGKVPVLYLFNLDESKSKIVEDKEYEDGKRRPGMQVITPAESIRPPVYYNMSVIVGSLLYVLGGVLEDPKNEQEDPENEQEWSFHNEVFFLDTNDPQKGWIKGPKMLNERCDGKAVAVESKIYVFGGNNKTVEDNSATSPPWAEFLDPDKNKWEPLPAPADICTRDLLYNPVVYDVPGEGKKIFFSCCYYIYDVNVQTWEEFFPPESLRPFSHNLTNNGNILYWTTFGHLYSFDMKTKDIDCGLVEGYRLSKYREELLIPEPTLLHLDGDYFCFITLKDLPEDRTKVRCTKFQVSHEGGLKASVVCRETYIIGHPLDINNTYAFVLNGKLGAEKSEGSSVFWQVKWSKNAMIDASTS